MTEIQQGKNRHLNQAKRGKNDEFYTQLSDIENELKHYKEHFKDKIVFCNCDDPYESNFFKYFVLNFQSLKLKKLIVTGFSISQIAFTQLQLFEVQGYENEENKVYKIEISELYDMNWDWAIDLSDIKEIIKYGKGKNKLIPLEKDGDFRSEESIELLKQADIVVSNPPFSLFREYVAQLMEYEKHFLIIWNQNAITYKEIFPLIKGNKVWLWCRNGAQSFKVPRTFNKDNVIINKQGEKIAKFWNIVRYTNLEHKKRHEELILYKNYNPSEYPKYDNYNAIEVSKVADIPCDYEGVMGVPITFLDKYNPDQFEIVGRADVNIAWEIMEFYIKGFKDKWWAPLVNWNFVYKRILIRKKQK